MKNKELEYAEALVSARKHIDLILAKRKSVDPDDIKEEVPQN